MAHACWQTKRKAVWQGCLSGCCQGCITCTLHQFHLACCRIMIGESWVWRLSSSNPENPSTFCWKTVDANHVRHVRQCFANLLQSASRIELCESECCWRLSPHDPKPANGKAGASATAQELPEMGLATCEPRLVMVRKPPTGTCTSRPAPVSHPNSKFVAIPLFPLPEGRKKKVE